MIYLNYFIILEKLHIHLTSKIFSAFRALKTKIVENKTGFILLTNIFCYTYYTKQLVNSILFWVLL